MSSSAVAARRIEVTAASATRSPRLTCPEGPVEEWYKSDFGLWLADHDLGSMEPGGLICKSSRDCRCRGERL